MNARLAKILTLMTMTRTRTTHPLDSSVARDGDDDGAGSITGASGSAA